MKGEVQAFLGYNLAVADLNRIIGLVVVNWPKRTSRGEVFSGHASSVGEGMEYNDSTMDDAGASGYPLSHYFIEGGTLMKVRTIQMVVAVMAVGFILAFAVSAIGADDENPCAADLKKFCSNIPFGEGRIADCMGQHKKEVSPTCQAYIEKVATEGFGNECRDEIMTYCPRKEGRVECLADHAGRGGQSPYGKLSGFCYKWLMVGALTKG